MEVLLLCNFSRCCILGYFHLRQLWSVYKVCRLCSINFDVATAVARTLCSFALFCSSSLLVPPWSLIPVLPALLLPRPSPRSHRARLQDSIIFIFSSSTIHQTPRGTTHRGYFFAAGWWYGKRLSLLRTWVFPALCFSHTPVKEALFVLVGGEPVFGGALLILIFFFVFFVLYLFGFGGYL